MPRISRALAVAAAVLAGCSSDTSGPLRGDIYEFRRFVSDGAGPDTLAFHWPGSALPVRVWAEDRFGMPGHVRNGIALWESAFLYGEYEAVLVGDSTIADVIVRVPDAIPGPVQTTLRMGSSAPGCEGATDVVVSDDRTELLLPIRVYLVTKFDPATVDPGPCFAVTAAHEIGHTLGLFQHSPDPNDLMYGSPEVGKLSRRDIHTAEAAYHYPANLEPTRP
ncbi:MAG TPA: matrixin family metalloprotease [Gemmatimonadales bacterium]|nr:matrixin family metalloprotease [Gemmatimonadales bacterium]